MGNLLPKIAVLIALFINCAMFREGLQIPKAENQIEIGKNVKKSLGYTLNSTFSINNSAPTISDPEYIKIWERTLAEEAINSGLFTEVKVSDKTTDYTVEFEVTEKSEVNQNLALLTGLTLYLFPSSATTEETLKATFKNKAGKVLGVFEKREKNVFWQQLFLIFVAPFKWPLSVSKDIKVDLSHAVYKDAASAMIFK